VASGGLQPHGEVGGGDVGRPRRREQGPAGPAAQQSAGVLWHPDGAPVSDGNAAGAAIHNCLGGGQLDRVRAAE
jgi:hypothetical protein